MKNNVQHQELSLNAHQKNKHNFSKSCLAAGSGESDEKSIKLIQKCKAVGSRGIASALIKAASKKFHQLPSEMARGKRRYITLIFKNWLDTATGTIETSV